MKSAITILGLFIATAIMIFLQSYTTKNLLPVNGNTELLPAISGYHIFKGDPAELVPADEYTSYQLATGLFTDYAEKQRLIKVPAGYKMTAVRDGLPDFPDGTILVKTFYYFIDKREPAKGKRLIETRVLIKSNSKWVAGTYVWNIQQTDAVLITNGLKTGVDWIDQHGESKFISYQVPTNKECGSCHNSDKTMSPIGLKIRNLNIDVARDKRTINQLSYFQQHGIMNQFDPSSFTSTPDWQNTSLSLGERARAYLDVNCAHCHSQNGFCAKSGLRLGYEIPFSATQIVQKKDRMIKLLSNRKMPLLGTTVIYQEGIALIKEYVNTLSQ
ncbi:MAG: hypothetical protein ABI480_09740 [Chitinophagaceae bacterium]